MILDKEESKRFISYTEKPILELKDVGSNVKIAKDLYAKYDAILDLNKRLEISKMKMDYIEKVAEADMSMFDNTFVELYRTGQMEIKPTEEIYQIEDLFIEEGKQKGKRIVHLISIMNEEDLDIITEDKMEGFEREEFMVFKFSECFYKIYEKCKEKKLVEDNKLIITNDIIEEVESILEKFDNKKHDKVPETYYGER